MDARKTARPMPRAAPVGTRKDKASFDLAIENQGKEVVTRSRK